MANIMFAFTFWATCPLVEFQRMREFLGARATLLSLGLDPFAISDGEQAGDQ